jgi:hypothetical protein
MAQLPYTDGTDGRGIRDFNELTRYFQRYPRAFYDDCFCASYGFLFSSAEREERLLAVYDKDASSAEMLRHVKALHRWQGTPPAVANKLLRYRLRLAFYEKQNPRAPTTTSDGYECKCAMAILTKDADAAGLSYTMCMSCTAAESAGHVTDALCPVLMLKQIEFGCGWADSNMHRVCCAAAQCLRGREPEASEHLQQKLERLRAALRASPEERRRIRARGNGCAAAGCARREPYAASFKTCSRCRSAHYCSTLCQVRLTAR